MARMDDEPPAHRVLIATADGGIAAELQATFAELGVAHRAVSSAKLATDEAETGAYDVAVVDLSLGGRGVGFLTELLERAPDLAVVTVTKADDPHLGVQAVRMGAADFVRAPLDRDEVRYVLAKSLRLVDF